MAKSPVSILYNADGYAVSVIADDGYYRLASQDNIAQWMGSTAPSVGRKGMTASIPVTLPTEQVAQAVTTTASVQPAVVGGVDAGNLVRYLKVDANGALLVVASAASVTLPRMVEMVYNQADGAIVANSYKRVQTYTVPTGYTGYLIRFTSWQNEAGFSRLVAETPMGTLSFPANTYVAGSVYSAPAFAGIVEAEVTVQLGAANNVTVTVTYTNQDGTGSRTGTISIPKSTIVGARFVLTLQTGDIGVRSIQNLSVAPSGGAGAIKMLGFVQLAYHNNVSTTASTETDFDAGSVAFPAGTVLGVEYSGGTVAKQRILEALIQLVAE